MKLLIKTSENDGRLALLPKYLETPWRIEAVDFNDHGALAKALADADAVISMNWSISMPPAPRLRLLQLPGAGTDDIDFDAVPAQAAVCNVFEHEIGISEYVLAAMLQWVVKLPALDGALRRAEWWGSYLRGPVHGELFGRTLGIVGYGRIGVETARRARAFGMNVIACSRTSRAGDGVVSRVDGMDRLDGLLAESDFVLIALPLAPSTERLIAAPQFGRMKRDGVLINVARGAIVDEAALFEACRSKQIGGAIIDAWYRYPAPGDKHCPPSALAFESLDNIIMTPHASAWTDGLLPRRNRGIARNMDRIARGERPETLVRPPRN